MSDINTVVVKGNLTRDAELKYTGSGTALCKFSIANNRWQGKDRDEYANFFEVILWGRQGEALNQYLTKGKPVIVQGELRQNRWEQEGQKRSRVEIIANEVNFAGGSRGGQTSEGRSTRTASVDANNGYTDDVYPDGDDFDDDIPF